MEYTVHGTRASADDGTAVIAAPTSWKYVKITSGSLSVDTPGTDVVNVIIKSGSTAKYEVSLNTALGTVEQLPEIVIAKGQPVYIALSAAVNVNYTLTYKIEDGF